jgi:hypothetical protein
MSDKPKHTPGPWRWEINRKHKSINLCGGLPAGTFDKTVLGFERYGMNGAAPVFHNWTEDGWGGKPNRAFELAVEKVGREHHADWFALIDHPNAHLIAAAPDLFEACRCALGQLTGNMDGDMDIGDPVELLRAAIAKAEGGAA